MRKVLTLAWVLLPVAAVKGAKKCLTWNPIAVLVSCLTPLFSKPARLNSKSRHPVLDAVITPPMVFLGIIFGFYLVDKIGNWIAVLLISIILSGMVSLFVFALRHGESLWFIHAQLNPLLEKIPGSANIPVKYYQVGTDLKDGLHGFIINSLHMLAAGAFWVSVSVGVIQLFIF